jgi:pimeloyl-ACP methyl ester carboxylesterase
MRNKARGCVLLLLSLLAASGSVSATSLEQEVAPGAGDNFNEARFRLWLPEKAGRVRGLFVLVPGLQGDGFGLVDDPRWQLLATKWNFGLLGCTLRDREGNYSLAEKGTGRALLDALKKLGVRSNHPELGEAPLAMWGHSAGGQFNYNFTNWAPERVIAFVAVKGGYYESQTDARSRSVPALFFIGEKDEAVRIENISRVFQTNRRQGAVWCLAVEPNEGHGVGRTVDFALAFFDAVVPQRLDASPSGEARLRELGQAAGWLGSLSSYEVAPATSYSQPVGEAVWLPGEQAALKWKEFVTRKDRADANAPAQVAGERRGARRITPALLAVAAGACALILLTIRFHKPLKRLLTS